MHSRLYWRAMWVLLAIAPVAAFAGLAAYGSGLGLPLLWVAGLCAFGGLLLLRMWMWQKAYEGRPQA